MPTANNAPSRPTATALRIGGAAALAFAALISLSAFIDTPAPAALSQAGLSQAGLSQAGLSQAGLSQAGLSQAGLSQAGLAPMAAAQPGLTVSTDRTTP
jgi:uncharacterized protein YjbI with pentapeptide repeats